MRLQNVNAYGWTAPESWSFPKFSCFHMHPLLEGLKLIELTKHKAIKTRSINLDPRAIIVFSLASSAQMIPPIVTAQMITTGRPLLPWVRGCRSIPCVGWVRHCNPLIVLGSPLYLQRQHLCNGTRKQKTYDTEFCSHISVFHAMSVLS